MISTRLVVTKGADVPKKLLAMIKDFIKNKKLFCAPWGFAGEHLIKHCTKDEDRGMLVTTFRNLGIDLSRFASDTSRLPKRNTHVDKDKEGKGRRIRVFAQGNRITLNVTVDDPQRLLSDIKNDKRSPLMPYIAEQLKKAGLEKDKKQ